MGKRLKKIEELIKRIEHGNVANRLLDLESENISLIERVKTLEHELERVNKTLAKEVEIQRMNKDTIGTLTHDLGKLKEVMAVFQTLANEIKSLNQKQTETQQIFSEWLYGKEGE